ncbi:Zinc finger protein 862 [Lucilia cuprina]|nr:Zinc finger protein 862 [Lucilia cuprina]
MDRSLQKYRQVWENDPIFKKWLRPTKDPLKASCFYCHSEISARYSDLIRHSETKKHKKSMQPFNGVFSVQPELSFSSKEVSEKQKAQARLSLYVAVHSSFLSVNHLGEVCNSEFADSKSSQFQLHRTKCSNIINNVLAPHFIDDLLKDIKDEYFSLILDEGTDISVEKLLGVVIRYYSSSKKQFVTTFLGLIDLVEGNADALLEGLERLINNMDLDFKKLVAIGTDIASVMTGINNGLYKKIKTKYELNNLILIRCVCHSLQLAVCSATDKYFPNNLEFLIRETYNWFSHSTVRQKTYVKIFKLLNGDGVYFML